MRKLQPLRKLAEDLESQGHDLTFVLADPEDLAFIDPAELEEAEDESESEQ